MSIQQLTQAYEAALALSRANPSPATRAAVVAASAALSAAIPQKRHGSYYYSRAGQRQALETGLYKRG